MSQKGFFIDVSRCTGCRTCSVACADLNNMPVGLNLRRVVEYEGGTYYVAGPVGYGMQANLPKASRLYKVDVLKGKNVIDSLLTTMSVAFVKYNSFTVMPYPLKYLRENFARK